MSAPLITFCAEWIVPVAREPIRNGFVTVSDGRIQAVGEGSADSAVSLGRVALLPALVNAHTHLELSFLRGRVPPSSSFNDWVTSLMTLRRVTAPDPKASEIIEAARDAVDQAYASG